MPGIRELLSGKYAREVFMYGVILGFGGIASLVLGIPLVGYLLTPLFEASPRVWRNVGKIDNFTVGTTVEVRYLDPHALAWAGSTNRVGAWLRRESTSQFIAFSIYCTHLGCPVHWLPAPANIFLCPCHGSAFTENGQVAAGPAQNPLVRLPVRLHKGQVQIKTTPIPLDSDCLITCV